MMMGAVRRVGAIAVSVMICGAAWAGTLTVKASDALMPAVNAHVEVQPAGVTGTTDAAGKWSGAVPAGDQRVIVWTDAGGTLRGGIKDIAMPAGNLDVDVALVEAIWIKDYFPLAVGNNWQYKYRHSETGGASWSATWRERVVRTETIAGEVASVIAASKDGTPEWEEIRGCNANGFTMYTQQHGTDTIKFDPPLRIGPLLPMGYKWVATGVGHHSDGSPDTPMTFTCGFDRFQNMRVPAGLFMNCARLSVKFEAGTEANDLTVWVARDVGVVREIERNDVRRNEKLLEEYSIRGLPMRPLRPIGRMGPKMP